MFGNNLGKKLDKISYSLLQIHMVYHALSSPFKMVQAFCGEFQVLNFSKLKF